MLLSNNKEVSRFIKILNDVNQLLKTVKSTSDYTIVKGKFICYPNSDLGDLGVLRLDPFDTGKKDNISEYLCLLTGGINGMDLYTFISANKKDINEVEINKTNFIIKTSNGEIFKSLDVTPEDFNYKNFSSFIKKPEFKEKTVLEQKTLSSEDKEEFSACSFPKLVVGDYDLRITPKLFIKLRESDEVVVKVYNYSDELNMIGIETTNPKLYTANQYFLYIK